MVKYLFRPFLCIYHLLVIILIAVISEDQKCICGRVCTFDWLQARILTLSAQEFVVHLRIPPALLRYPSQHMPTLEC